MYSIEVDVSCPSPWGHGDSNTKTGRACLDGVAAALQHVIVEMKRERCFNTVPLL